MNYLAHLYFSQQTPASRVGSLMGDFFHGPLSQIDDVSLAEAIATHRWVDGYTDQHVEVVALRTAMSGPHRRYAGVIIDLAFDHFLIQHWSRYSVLSLEHWLAAVYDDLACYRGVIPNRMRPVLQRLIEQRWLASYAERKTLALALNRMAARVTKPEKLVAAGLLFDQHYEQLEMAFVPFFDDLIAAMAQEHWRNLLVE